MDVTGVLSLLREYRMFDNVDEQTLLRAAGRALAKVTHRLKADVEPDDPRVTAVAAALARFGLFSQMLADGDRFASFRAGDVAIARDLKKEFEAERMLRDEALAEAADILRDGGFYAVFQ